jgi:hypothetical protein
MNTITSIESWLHGGANPGGRADALLGVAWNVEPGVGAGVALNVARWTRAGRLILRRYQLPAGAAQDSVVEYRNRHWVLHARSFDFAPLGAPRPEYPADVAERLRRQALTAARYDHAPRWLDQGLPGAAAHTRRLYSHYHAKALPLVLAAAPDGYELHLSLGGRPGLYRVQHAQLPSEVTRVITRRLKFKVLQQELDPMVEANWTQTSHPVLGGLARIFREDYAIAPDGRTIYRPGTAEDCWSFPDHDTPEAALRFQEQAPADMPRVPGALAWYQVAYHGAAVRIVSYSPRREPVEDVIRVERGLVRWRGREFLLTPYGELLAQNHATPAGLVL